MAGIVPEIDFTPLAQLGQVYSQAKQKAVRDQVLGSIPADASPESLGQAGVALAKIGDPAGMSLIHLAQSATRDTRDFGFRTQESNRAQSNADRAFDFQKQQADEAARGYETREVDDGNGGKMLVRIHKATGEVVKSPIAGAQDAPTNPYAYGKQNEGQAKDSGYANRMFNAERVLRSPEVEGSKDANGNWVEGASTNLKQNLLGKAPGLLSNYLTDANYQKFDQAKRDFVNAVLRRESGAAISQSEFDNAHKQYFPQPGDTVERIEQKRRNRQDAIAGVAGGGGQTYKPPFTFGPNGEMVATNNPVQGATPQPKPPQPGGGITRQVVEAARANPQAALAEAKQAIANGANPEAVAIRLKQAGINPALLTGETTTGFGSPGQRQ